MTFQQLELEIEDCRRQLLAIDIGERVVLYLPQVTHSIALLLAAEREKIDAVLVSRLYPESYAHAAQQEARASCTLTLEGRSLAILVARSVGDMSARGARATDAREAIVGILTSGSTGRPKCAQHTWTSLLAGIKRSPKREGKRWLLCYPMSHIAALQVIAQCLVNRCTLVIPEDLGAHTVEDAVSKHRVQCISSTPTFVRQLLNRASPSFWEDSCLEHVVLGGEIVDGALLAGLRKAAPHTRITHVYASTELGPVIAVHDGREGFDAALLDGVRLKLVDGELFVRRSVSSMRSYAGHDTLAEPWWPTGDLVAVDSGRARFRGRKQHIINVGGFKVSPATVEDVLLGVDGIVQVCVVAHPSSLAGNLVKAIVQLRDGVDRAEFRARAVAECGVRLPSHMHPRIFEFVDQMPTTVTQKSSSRSTTAKRKTENDDG